MYSSPFSNEENWGSKYVQDPAVNQGEAAGFCEKVTTGSFVHRLTSQRSTVVPDWIRSPSQMLS